MCKLLLEKYMPGPSPELKNYTLQAVAGAGKTTHLINQVMKSIEQSKEKGQKSPRIMITTFTRKATGEVKERIMKQAIAEKNWELVNAVSDTSQIFVSTLHGILYYFLKRYHPHWSSFSQLINDRQILLSARSVLRDVFESNPQYVSLLEHYRYHDILNLILQHKEGLISTEPLSQQEMNQQWATTLQTILRQNLTIDFSDLDTLKEACIKQKKDLKNKTDSAMLDKLFTTCHPKNFKNLEINQLLLQKLAQEFHSHWTKLKDKKGFIQIEDLENETLKIIQTQKHIVSSFSKDWQSWFIDEYQDINPIQEKILNSFTQYAKQVWVVGDPQQSIYLFRRADPNVFKRRVEATKSQGVLEIKNTNFRSHPNLIEFFNDFFKKEFQQMNYEKTKSLSTESSVQFLIYKNKQDEQQILAQKLHQLLKTHSPGDICILLKTNQDVIDTGHFLRKLKLPVQTHSQNLLRREILDALFFLKFLINPLDNENLIGLLRSPYFYMPDWEISAHSHRGRSLWVNLQEIKNHPVLQALNNLIKKSEQEGISSAFSSFLEEYLVIDLCYYQDPTGEQENNLWNLLIEMQTKEQNIHFKYYQFIEEKLNQFKTYGVDSAGTSPQLLNFIQLMTIHQSKGLEFEHVIIPNVDDSLIPSDSNRLVVFPKSQRWSFSITNENKEAIHSVQQKIWKDKKREESLQEQERLLYVAMTRAKKTLTLTCQEKNLMKSTSSNNWLGRFSYFSKIKEQIEKNPDKNEIHIKEKSYSTVLLRT